MNNKVYEPCEFKLVNKISFFKRITSHRRENDKVIEMIENPSKSRPLLSDEVNTDEQIVPNVSQIIPNVPELVLNLTEDDNADDNADEVKETTFTNCILDEDCKKYTKIVKKIIFLIVVSFLVSSLMKITQ